MRALWATLIGVALAILPAPVHAGGATFQWDEPFYTPGDVAIGSVEVWAKGLAGRPEDGPYDAYLVGLHDPLIRLPADAIHLGEIEVLEWPPTAPSDEHALARVTFTVPDVPPGDYLVTTCSERCGKPLGDIVPSLLTVVASEEEGRLVVEIGRLEDKLSRLTGVAQFTRTRVADHIDATDLRFQALERRVDALSKQVDGLTVGGEDEETAASADGSGMWGALPFALGTLGMLALWLVLAQRKERAIAS